MRHVSPLSLQRRHRLQKPKSPGVAYCCLVGLLAISILLLPCRADAQSVVRLAVQDLDGTCRVFALPKERSDELQARIINYSEVLLEKAQTSFDRMAEIRFAAAREQVPAFGNWTYGWFESYVLSFRLMMQLYIGLKRGFSEGWPPDFIERLRDDLAAPVREAFKENLLQAGLSPELHLRDLDLIASALDDDWRRIITDFRAQLLQNPNVPGPAGYRISLIVPTSDFVDGLSAAAPRSTEEMVSAIQADTTVIFQAMRTIVPRLGTILLRVSEFGGLIFTIAVVGLAFGGLLGFLAGAFLGVAIYWFVDWLFNRTDAFFNQVDFEKNVLDILNQAQAKLSGNAGDTFRQLLLRRLALISPSPGSCP